jgi:hypothetical protein
MNIWGAAVWGLAGGLCVEALALHSMIRGASDWSWRKPIPQGLLAYLISVFLRAGASAGLAAAVAGSGQVAGPFAAFALGVAAPLMIEKLSRAIPLADTLSVPEQPIAREHDHIVSAEQQGMEVVNTATPAVGGARDAR